MRSRIRTTLYMILAAAMLPWLAVPAAAMQTVPAISWPGANTVKKCDVVLSMDVSGLDFADQKLYAVDNKMGKVWVLERDELGNLEFAPGYEEGKPVRFSQNVDGEIPDTEGITVAGDGLLYLASERDDVSDAGNKSSILQVDIHTEESVLNVRQQWDLTPSLPEVESNKGIEAVEWVGFAALEGKLWDQVTGAVFDSKLYPDAVAQGVFFTALEDNGHVYGYILKEDGSSIQVAHIDSQLGMAMALDYDEYENLLWVAADDGGQNRLAQIKLNRMKNPLVTHVLPSKGLNKSANNEGFAIVQAELTQDDLRSVYRVTDGILYGALTEEKIDSTYYMTFWEKLEKKWIEETKR